MIVKKEKIIDIINKLPEETSWEDIIYTLIMNMKLEESKEDFENGNYITLDELNKERDEDYVYNFINKI